MYVGSVWNSWMVVWKYATAFANETEESCMYVRFTTAL